MDDSTEKREADNTEKVCGINLSGLTYEVKVKSALLYESCFVEKTHQTLWTRHHLKKFDRETHCSRPAVDFTAKGLPDSPKLDFEKDYKKV